MALNAYLTAVQNLLGTGPAGNLYPTATLTGYINEARQHVASDGQCVRALPVIQGAVTAVAVVSGGTGYTSPPIVTITPPDSPSGFLPFPNGNQAVAFASVSGGSVTAVTVSSGGSGYFAPQVTFSSGGGHGAVGLVTTSVSNATAAGQEIYAFSSVNPIVASSGSGISHILAVNSVSIIWSTFRYTLMRQSFSKYQALTRTYTAGYEYMPAVMAQFGQGANGTLYMYPIANQPYQMEWDCYCQPLPLATDNDVEAIPEPFNEAVKYYAARMAYLQSQRFGDAEMMYNEDPTKLGLYQKSMQRARRVSNPRAVMSWYGRAP